MTTGDAAEALDGERLAAEGEAANGKAERVQRAARGDGDRPRTGEPTAATWAVGTALPATPDGYALAYLPIVAEFFPHDYTPPATFKAREETPVLTQTIIINR